MRYRVYNFSSSFDLNVEINIYRSSIFPNKGLSFYKTYEMIDEKKVRNSNFFDWIKTVFFGKEEYKVKILNCFVRRDGEILPILEGPILGDDGIEYYTLTDEDGYPYTVTIDKDDQTSNSCNICKVYDCPIIELRGFSNNNQDVSFTFIKIEELSNFLKWFKENLVKKEESFFESVSGKEYTLNDSEIEEICKETFKEEKIDLFKNFKENNHE